MIYRALGIMSGSSMDGLDLAYVHLHSSQGKWNYTLAEAVTIPHTSEWISRLDAAPELSAREYLLLHHEFGVYIGQEVNKFIEERNLDFQIQLIASHGHTVFHMPQHGTTAQLGSGAAIAAQTGLQVVTDLRSLDMALGGQGAPIVPIGERWLFSGYDYFLNLGGIANITLAVDGIYQAFDVCPANRVLNLLAQKRGQAFDRDGAWASAGQVIIPLLEALDGLDYYLLPPPKSLPNQFGTEVVWGLIKASGCPVEDGLRTYTEHIARQLARALDAKPGGKMLVTGGGAHNVFLVERITALLDPLGISISVADPMVTDFKEALIMAFMGVLRLREEENTLASVTGALRPSIGGALWNGQEG
jgi:anhydro-N-acetylmuramic acid kinase